MNLRAVHAKQSAALEEKNRKKLDPVSYNQKIFDAFQLRVIYERDKTGFEESKEFPLKMGEVIAARYQVMEYLGSAAFSRAVQCLDLETNQMVMCCFRVFFFLIHNVSARVSVVRGQLPGQPPRRLPRQPPHRSWGG